MRIARKDMTDTQKFFVDVRKTGSVGAHSHDLADSIPSLNVSMRAKNCTRKGQQIYVRQESRNGRNGARYWLEGFQPPDATPVVPDGPGSESSDGTPEGGRPEADQEGRDPVTLNRAVRRGSNVSRSETESSRGSVTALSIVSPDGPQAVGLSSDAAKPSSPTEAADRPGTLSWMWDKRRGWRVEPTPEWAQRAA